MLIGIFGQMGSGKTLIMSILAYELRKKGVELYTNYDLSGTTERIRTIEDLKQKDTGIVALDEFWLTVDSRDWKNNIFWTQWILQTRKKNLIVFYTTQTTGQVDIRIRHATNLWIFCEKNKKKKYFRYTYLSGTNHTIVKSFKLSYEKAKAYYTKYDTYEVLKPIKSYVKSNKYKTYSVQENVSPGTKDAANN